MTGLPPSERLAARPRAEVELHSGPEAIAAEWDELAVRAGATPFARPAWFDNWWQVFGSGDLRILALRDGERLRGVLPLVARGAVLAAPTNVHTPLFEPVVEDANAAAQLFDAAFELDARRLELTEIDADGVAAQGLVRAASERGWRVRSRALRRAPFLRTAESADAYEAGLAKGRRRELRRRRRRLEEMGRLAIEWADGSERLSTLLADGLAVEGSGWKTAAGTAITSSADTVRYYAAVARWAASLGLLELGFVRLDGRVLAFRLVLWDQRRCYALKAGFDTAYRAAAPGVLLLHELIRRAHDRGVETIELLGEATPYKLEWTSDTRTIARIQAFRPTLPGRVDHLNVSFVRPIARRCAQVGGR